ncbi:90S preribosome component RRP12 [Histoplasma capsulatum var. duboisii H88]|uniref:90S preribosome component RRP12 n=1 Tax=Ajellomyces capsulatus (strain H88) TaxID=544711 RepID=A0A8A1LTP7_AJEC8|nr:90S preribosome component RRP12 [Histoplasma capsulatum var. duboisii H88]
MSAVATGRPGCGRMGSTIHTDRPAQSYGWPNDTGGRPQTQGAQAGARCLSTCGKESPTKPVAGPSCGGYVCGNSAAYAGRECRRGGEGEKGPTWPAADKPA